MDKFLAILKFLGIGALFIAGIVIAVMVVVGMFALMWALRFIFIAIALVLFVGFGLFLLYDRYVVRRA